MNNLSKNATSDQLVVKANNLIEAKFRFSLWEMRVFTRMVSLINKSDTDFKLHRLYIKDLIDFFGVVSKDDYATIKEVPRSLAKKQIEMPYLDKNGEKRWSLITLFPVVTTPDSDDGGNAYIEMMFNHILIDTLLELQSFYSKYDIRNIISLRSMYSFRIFELLKQYELIGKRSFAVDDLKEILCVSDKYKLYSDFKKRVILKAEKDLKKFCDIAFSFEEKKRGRKVEKITFFIFKNNPKGREIKLLTKEKKVSPQQIINLETIEDTSLFQELWTLIKGYGISKRTFQKYVDDFPEDYLRKWVPYFQKIMKMPEKAKNIKNPAGYLVKLLQTNPENIPIEQKKKKVQENKELQGKKKKLEEGLKKMQQQLFNKEKELAIKLLGENEGLSERVFSYVKQHKPSCVEEDLSFIENFTGNFLFAVFAMKAIETEFSKSFEVLRNAHQDTITKIKAQIRQLN